MSQKSINSQTISKLFSSRKFILGLAKKRGFDTEDYESFSVNEIVIMYADKITNSMQQTIDETEYRRQKQIAYNTENNITPKALNKSLDSVLAKNSVSTYSYELEAAKAAEPESEYLSKPELEKKIREKRKTMEQAAKALDFIVAAQLRDEIKVYQEKLEAIKD